MFLHRTHSETRPVMGGGALTGWHCVAISHHTLSIHEIQIVEFFFVRQNKPFKNKFVAEMNFSTPVWRETQKGKEKSSRFNWPRITSPNTDGEGPWPLLQPSTWGHYDALALVSRWWNPFFSTSCLMLIGPGKLSSVENDSDWSFLSGPHWNPEGPVDVLRLDINLWQT